MSIAPGITAQALSALHAWADTIIADGLLPAYLVGSALRVHTPRDIDVRVILADRDFEQRFMPPAAWLSEGLSGEWSPQRLRWSDVCVAHARAARRATGLPIDFQIVPRSDTRFDGPRLPLGSHCRTGRPRLAPGERRTAQLWCNVTPEEADRVMREATRRGVSVSHLVRTVLAREFPTTEKPARPRAAL